MLCPKNVHRIRVSWIWLCLGVGLLFVLESAEARPRLDGRTSVRSGRRSPIRLKARQWRDHRNRYRPRHTQKRAGQTKVIGVTGGIASGKSSVSRMLKNLGARVVDADVLARRVVEPGKPAYRDIVKTFGKQVLKSDGTLDRKRLGRIVFSDGHKLQQLNEITHPRIASAAKREIARHKRLKAPLVVYDAALMVEKGWHRDLDGLVVVSVPERVQLQRLMQRDGLGRSAAKKRIRSQLPQSAKLKVADHVIDNSGTLHQTQQQVKRLWQGLVSGPR